MLHARLIVTLGLALLATALFVGALRWRRPGSKYSGAGEGLAAALAFFFVLVFAATFALSGWFTPLGPAWRGVPLVSTLTIALVIALILYVTAAPQRRLAADGASEATAPRVSFGFWILLVVLALIGLASFALGPTRPAP